MTSDTEIRRIVQEELRRFNHNDLGDMPHQAIVNRDHDGRYHRKHATIYLDIGSRIVFGKPDVDGSFQFIVESGAFEIQVRDSDAWTYVGRWSPP